MAARITRRGAPLNATSRDEAKNAQEPKAAARAAGGLHDAIVARSAEKAEATLARLSGVLPPPRPPKDAAEPMRPLVDGLTVHAKSGDLERALRAWLQRTRENSGCSTPRAADDTDAPSTGGSEEGPEVSWTPPDGTASSTDELMAALFGIMREEQEQQNEDAQDQKDAMSGSRIPQAPASDDSGAPDSTGDGEPDDPGASDAAAAVSAAAKALADLAAKAAKAVKTAR